MALDELPNDSEGGRMKNRVGDKSVGGLSVARRVRKTEIKTNQIEKQFAGQEGQEKIS